MAVPVQLSRNIRAQQKRIRDKRVTTSLRTWAVARNDGRDHVDSGWHFANMHLESVGPGQ